MATFEVKVRRVEIEEHPNADALELAKVDDYRAIVPKGQLQTGDYVVYIPEAAIVPDWIIQLMGLEGKLAGKDKNRVKAIKLRGQLSQGLCLPTVPHELDETMITIPAPPSDKGDGLRIWVKENEDVTAALGITKYEPPIPTHMAGEVDNVFGNTLKYDIENIKNYPTVLQEDEEVVVTEKLHGTWTCLGYQVELDRPIVTSKGLSGRGVAFKMNEANEKNLYVQQYKKLNHVIAELVSRLDDTVYVLGETFGPGVQDLTYGVTDKTFRVFDIYVGAAGAGKYLDYDEMKELCDTVGLETVPVLYQGPYTREKINELTNGKDTINAHNIREGVVIKPTTERFDYELGGRVNLKSISEAYLLRKGGTELQ